MLEEIHLLDGYGIGLVIERLRVRIPPSALPGSLGQLSLPLKASIGLKSAITRLIWHIDCRCLHLPRVFGDGRFNGTIQNVVGPTLVAMTTKFGLGAEI